MADQKDFHRVRRAPKQGHYDSETIHRILDNNFICHIALESDGQVFSIPTMYGRDGDLIYIHGASTSRLINHSSTHTITLSGVRVNDLVLAKSAFHHSMNYESVVVFGKGRLVKEDEKLHALKVISDHVLPGRWEESRLTNEKELKATSVLAISIEQASAKMRTGEPNDDKEDQDLPVWSGLLPLDTKWGRPIAQDPSQTILPNSLRSKMKLD